MVYFLPSLRETSRTHLLGRGVGGNGTRLPDADAFTGSVHALERHGGRHDVERSQADIQSCSTIVAILQIRCSLPTGADDGNERFQRIRTSNLGARLEIMKQA